MDKCSNVFASFPFTFSFFLPFPLMLSINTTLFQLVTSWKDFTIFTWGVWQCLRVCACVCVCVCVGVHVTVFRSAFLFVVRVKEWKTLEREQDIDCVFACVFVYLYTIKKKHITYVCIWIKYSLLSHLVSFSLTLTQAFMSVSYLLLFLSHIHHMSPILF